MNDSERERIAVLETQHEQLMRELRAVRQDIAEIKRQVTSWRGVVFGIVLTVSALWSVGIAGLQVVRHKLGV